MEQPDWGGIPKLTTFPLLFVCAVVSILVVCNFTHLRSGRACLSIREDEIASEAMGINTTKYKVIVLCDWCVISFFSWSIVCL